VPPTAAGGVASGRWRHGRWTWGWLNQVRPRRLTAQAAGDLALVAFIVAGAIGLDLYHLADTSLYLDEAMSAELALRPWGITWGYLWGPEDHMTLYYVLLHLWVQVTGVLGWAPTELILRLPSILFAAAAATVLYLLGRRCWSRTAALLATTLYLLNPLQLFHAQKARSYSLQLLLLCLAWYALFAILAGLPRQRWWWLLFGVAMTLALYAQPFSALVLASQLAAYGVYLVVPGPWRPHARQGLRALVVTLAASGAAVVPLLIDVHLHGQSNQFVPPASLSAIGNILLLGTSDTLLLVAVLVVVCLAGIALVALPRLSGIARGVAPGNPTVQPRGSRLAAFERVRPGVLALLCWLCVPLILSFGLTQPALNLHLFWWRYLVVVVPPLCLLAGIAVAALRWTPLRLALGLLLVVVALPKAVAYYPTAQLTDWRSSSQWVERHYQVGDGVICVLSLGCSAPLQYYFQAYPGPATLTADAPGNWIWAHHRAIPIDPGTIARYAAQHARVFLVVSSYGSSGDTVAGAQQARTWLDTHEQLLAQYAAEAVTVRLYAVVSGASGP
jgi:4-amino-4-deoxy-L-arabinose transferase-like glycosyltransferase